MAEPKAPEVVTHIAQTWLGALGGILAIVGVVAAPITSGDTAFRGARLILADFLKLDQKKNTNRLVIAIPIFAITILLLWFNSSNADGFNVIWRYFGLFNQILACVVLWTVTAYLVRRGGNKYLITFIPACFMTAVCSTYILVDGIGFNMDNRYSPLFALVATMLSVYLFFVFKRNRK